MAVTKVTMGNRFRKLTEYTRRWWPLGHNSISPIARTILQKKKEKFFLQPGCKRLHLQALSDRCHVAAHESQSKDREGALASAPKQRTDPSAWAQTSG
jgi:hypothetical protein